MAVQEPSIPSALLAVGTTSVCTMSNILTAVMLHPGSAASTLTVYDNATAGSGTAICTMQGVANGATVIIPFDSGIFAKNGLTCVVTGTGAQAQVYFQLE